MQPRKLLYIAIMLTAFGLNCFYIAGLHQKIKHLTHDYADYILKHQAE